MKDFFGEDLCAAAAQFTWRVCSQVRVGRKQAKQQRLPTKQLGGLELELNQAAHAQLPRLPSGAAMILARTRSQTPLLPLPSPGLDMRRATPAPSPPRPTWSRSLAESRSTMPGSALPRLSSELLPTLPSPATLWSTPPAPRRPSPSSGTPTDPTPPPPTLPRPSSTPP